MPIKSQLGFNADQPSESSPVRTPGLRSAGTGTLLFRAYPLLCVGLGAALLGVFAYRDEHSALLAAIGLAAIGALGCLSVWGQARASADREDRLKRAESAVRESDARYRALLRDLPAMLFTVDALGTVVSVNPCGAHQLGYDAPELEGRPVLEVFHPADRPAVADRLKACLERPQGVYRWRSRKIRKDGSSVWVEESARAIPGPSGEALVLVVGVDLPAGRRPEAEQHYHQRLLQTVFDAIPVGLTVKDAGGKDIVVNRAFLEMMGHPAGEYIGKSVDQLPFLPADYRAAIQEWDRHVRETRTALDLAEVRTPTAKGEVIRRIVKVPILDDHGRLEGIITLSEDVTARRKAEQEARRSQQLLQTVFETIPHALVVKDRAGRYQMVNKAWCARYGVERQDWLGKTFSDVPRTEGVREQVLRQDFEVLSTGTSSSVDGSETVAGGALSHYQAIKAPLKDEHGNVTGLVGVVVDVTGRRRAEQELRASESLMKTAFDALPVSLFVKDLDGRFIKVNQTQADNYGLSVDGMIGKHWEELAHRIHANVPQTRRDDAEVIRGKRLDIPEGEFIVASGQKRWFRTIKVPLRNPDGAVIGIVGLVVDVTERRVAEEERLALELALQGTQNLETLGAVAAGLAQQYNRTVQQILGFAELAALDLPETNPARASVNMLLAGCNNAVKLTRQLLTGAQRAGFSLVPVDVAALARTLLADWTPVAGQQGAVKLQPVIEPAVALANRMLLRQVLRSVLIRAWEAASQTGGTVSVTTGTLSLESHELDASYSNQGLNPGRYAYVEIQHNGAVPSQEEMAKLYDRFPDPAPFGRGLSLAAVRGTVHGFDGALRVVFAPHEATSYRVLIPAAPDLDAPGAMA